MKQSGSMRLSRNVVPRRYDLWLQPDLETGVVTGHVGILVHVEAPTRSMRLHSLELQLSDVVIRAADGRDDPATVSLDPGLEQVELAFVRDIPTGDATLRVRFAGRLSDGLAGFYRRTLAGPDGRTAVIAATESFPTNARRIFPCWDEPDFKAVFALQVVADNLLTVLANGAEEEREALPGGRVRVRFSETIPMSPYLFALALGPFELSEARDVGGIPVRIAATPGRGALGDVALDAGAHALRFFTEYFGMPCPAPKMDHVALPDFSLGAMENLGCVTYREDTLLVHPTDSSLIERQAVTSTVSHESSHMWFGDLVTMRWWNGAWLNEAFATFMERLSSDAGHPEWDVWTEAQLDREQALSVDGLRATRPVEYPVERPEDVWGMFDTLTYQKGSAVLRMMEQYLGANAFRDGIRLYLERHQFGSVETHDLWDALEAAAGEPVRRVMDGFVSTGGHPVVNIARRGPDELWLSAGRFSYDPEQEAPSDWTIPVTVGVHHEDGRTKTHRVLLGTEPVAISLPGTGSWAVVNEGAAGFFRVSYDPQTLADLTARFEDLGPVDRLSLCHDVWAAALSRRLSLEPVAELLRRLSSTPEPELFSWARGVLAVLQRTADANERIDGFARRLAEPLLSSIGWESRKGDPPRYGRLRAELIQLLGTVGEDAAVRQHALSLFHADGAGTPPDLAAAVAAVAAWAGGAREWEVMRERVVAARTPQDVRRNLATLASFDDRALLQKTLGFVLSDTVRLQDKGRGLGRVLANQHGAELAWDAVEAHWDVLTGSGAPNGLAPVVSALAVVTDDRVTDRAWAWLRAYPLPLERQIRQAEERGAVERAFRMHHRGHLEAVLGGR